MVPSSISSDSWSTAAGASSVKRLVTSVSRMAVRAVEAGTDSVAMEALM